MIVSTAARRALRGATSPLHWPPAATGAALQPRLMPMSCRRHQPLATSSVTSRHDGRGVVGSLEAGKWIGRASSTSKTPPEEDGDTSAKPPSDTSESPPDEQKQMDSYGVSNFQKMLRYQKPGTHQQRSSRSFNQRGGNNRFHRRDGRYDERSHQRSDGHDDRERKSDYSTLRERVAARQGRTVKAETDSETHDRPDAKSAPTRVRYRWRDRPSRPYEPKQRWTKRYDVPKPKAATSDWILVSNTPPMSNLSDMYQSLNEIMAYEIEKGIIDLDALESSHRDNGATLSALHELGATESLYSTQQIADDDGNVPLWTPPSDDQSFQEHPCPFIYEARMHLSYRARPDGWFLRMPNRSVVHAVLNHVRRAEKHRQQQQPRLRMENESLKGERREWRKGLWRGVWNEYERKFAEEERRAQLEEESQEEKGLMWGDSLGDTQEEETTEKEGSTVEAESGAGSISPVEEETGATEQYAAGDGQSEANEYLQQYLEAHPYPAQSMTTSTEQSPYQFLKSGSKTLGVQEFSPFPFDHSSPGNEQLPWEQHTFHLSSMLNLSDSVVRVETADLKVNAGDIRYLFRGYDLESIFPDSANAATLPLCFSEFPQSLGWNIHSHGNVDMLIRGSAARFGRNNAAGGPSMARRHAFFVRFASPADARMAVRDQEAIQRPHSALDVVQYPRQW